MPQTDKITLFFISAPDYKLSSIENFLKKRNYNVHIETDVKAGLLRLIEVQPDFVFIALDHDNPKIEVLPQIIEQCLKTTVIPFTHSSSREALKKLDENTYIHKIFPPLSGPAIERLTLKLRAQAQKASDESSSRAKNFDNVVNSFLDQLNSEKHKIKSTETQPDKAKTLRLKEKNLFFANSKKNKISGSHKENLKKYFAASIKSDLTDILETCAHETTSNVYSLKDKKTVYCLLVQSRDWSGHLMAYANTPLEKYLLEPIFKNWISKEFPPLNEQESTVFFEIQIDLKDFQIWAENKTEYAETIKHNGSEITLNFVGIEPQHLLMDFDEENDLVDVRIEWIPLQTDLNLSLYLHLPENKKFLLYTPKNKRMNEHQKQRLQENRVEKLYTPIEFEEEVKRLKMIQYFELLFSGLGTESAE